MSDTAQRPPGEPTLRDVRDQIREDLDPLFGDWPITIDAAPPKPGHVPPHMQGVTVLGDIRITWEDGPSLEKVDRMIEPYRMAYSVRGGAYLLNIHTTHVCSEWMRSWAEKKAAAEGYAKNVVATRAEKILREAEFREPNPGAGLAELVTRKLYVAFPDYVLKFNVHIYADHPSALIVVVTWFGGPTENDVLGALLRRYQKSSDKIVFRMNRQLSNEEAARITISARRLGIEAENISLKDLEEAVEEKSGKKQTR